MGDKQLRRKTAECPVCYEMFSPQGLVGHLRYAHNSPGVLRGKGSTAKVQRSMLVSGKRPPSLVKPLMARTEMDRIIAEMELMDASEPSPCCKATLRSAKAVLGIPDLALDGCFICAKCGEWYHCEAGKAVRLFDYKGKKYVAERETIFRHLPQEPVNNLEDKGH